MKEAFILVCSMTILLEQASSITVCHWKVNIEIDTGMGCLLSAAEKAKSASKSM